MRIYFMESKIYGERGGVYCKESLKGRGIFHPNKKSVIDPIPRGTNNLLLNCFVSKESKTKGNATPKVNVSIECAIV